MVQTGGVAVTTEGKVRFGRRRCGGGKFHFGYVKCETPIRHTGANHRYAGGYTGEGNF